MNYRLPALAALLLFGCGDQSPTTPENPVTSDTTAATARYFPVMDFLKSEIAKVDSTPVGIMKYTSRGSANDSGYIQPQEFRMMAAEFLPAALDDSIFKKEFKETSFMDKTTGGATFFYSTINENLDLKRVDVVSQATDSYDKIKSIYLEKSYTKGDSSVIQKLFWKPERQFQVITQVSVKSGEPVTEVVRVVWDNRE